MRELRRGLAAAVALCLFFAPSSLTQDAVKRLLVNGRELHNEIQVAPRSESKVTEYFPSFQEYQDLVMFHPKFGYYSSGRVNFNVDYQTFPNVLAPYFGQMVTEQVFRMWQGMRRAGTLGAGDVFTIAEFGAGNGMLAESILDYLGEKAKEKPDAGWSEFAAQVRYICYDRSPALSEEQRQRNARFGKQFEARQADATHLTATIAPGSLKGVVLSNELPDAFSVQKVILSPGGSAEVAMVVPWLPGDAWAKLRKQVPPQVGEAVERNDRAVKRIFFPASREARVYLTRSSFAALLEALAPSKDYAAAVGMLDFQEVYVPAGAIVELQEHLDRYSRFYASQLAGDRRGLVTYINLGVEQFIRGAGQILAAGYVVTLDYGADWAGIMAQDNFPHLRTFGPANRSSSVIPESDEYDQDVDGEQYTTDPYQGPTLNDLTTDVNFSLMAVAGRLAGLTTVYFGPQKALRSGTAISLAAVPPDREHDGALKDEFKDWANEFQTNDNYKLMVQQKRNTDSQYVYPDANPESLGVSEASESRAPQRPQTTRVRSGGAPAP